MARSPKSAPAVTATPDSKSTVIASNWKGKPVTFTYDEVETPELSRPGRSGGPNPHAEAIKTVIGLKGQEKGARAMTVDASDAFAHVKHLRNGAGKDASMRVEVKTLDGKPVSTKDNKALAALPKDAKVRITFWAVDKIVRKTPPKPAAPAADAPAETPAADAPAETPA